jgi:hypothetical protein
MVTSSPPALGLACEAAEAGTMLRPPQGRSAVLLNKVGSLSLAARDAQPLYGAPSQCVCLISGDRQ